MPNIMPERSVALLSVFVDNSNGQNICFKNLETFGHFSNRNFYAALEAAAIFTLFP